MEQNVIFQQQNGNGVNPPANPPVNAPTQPLQTPSLPTSSQIPPQPTVPQQPSPFMSQSGLPSQPPISTMPGSVPPIPPITPTPPPPPSRFSGLPGVSGFPLWVKIAAGIVGFIFLFFIITIMFSSKKTASNEKVTLEYWELWENKSTLDQLLSDFHKQYPNITINIVVADPKQYSDRVQARIKAGTGPDIFSYHNSWVPELLSVLSPLSTDAISVSDFNKYFYPVAQKDLTHRGAIYGIPFEIDTLALFINDDILQAAGGKPPTTWDSFNSITSTTTVKDSDGKIKTAGAAMGTYDNIAHASDIMAMLFAQNGANQTNLTSTLKNSTDALSFYSSFAINQGASVWDNTLPNSLVAFAQGNVAMIFGYSYDIFTIRVMNPTLKFSVYQVPRLPGRQITTASYWVQGVSARSKHQKEAMLLMHFLAQKETEEKLYALESKTRPFGEPYARVDLANTLKDDPMVYPFVAQAKTATSTYFSSNTNDSGINAQMNGYLGNAIRSLFNSTSADSAITTLAQGVSQILGQYGIQ
ncbi:MAG TPA: extracellular solute-binding protein [Candidatus Saccharimonadales bacterium]|nr:extracellular solute-binding protein [Candidatus Saccharimonadales bacterium]